MGVMDAWVGLHNEVGHAPSSSDFNRQHCFGIVPPFHMWSDDVDTALLNSTSSALPNVKFQLLGGVHQSCLLHFMIYRIEANRVTSRM